MSFQLKAQEVKKELSRIVIDAGHGGKDSGTMGTKRYKTYEKDIALSISLKLGSYISRAYPQVDIVYTRETDIFLELRERTELANRSDADLFISIHCDGFTSPKASGASVFVMGMSKLKENMDVAMRENSVIYMEDDYKQKYDGFDPKTPESYIVFSLMQNTYLDQSILFAESIENEFANRAKRKSRGVKQAPFYVISRVNMPSVLIETGFLTNPKEEDYLNTEAGQDHLASAIFRAFRLYKSSVDRVYTNNAKSIEKGKYPKIISDKSISNQYVVTYKVQIGTYLKSMKDEDIFVNLVAEEEKINGSYKYFTQPVNTKKEADDRKRSLREKGFEGAFVVAFLDGKQISTKEALDLQMKNMNNEKIK